MKSIPYARYFGEMDLTEEQTSDRIRFALEFEDVILTAFSYVELDNDDKAVELIEEFYKDYLGTFDELNNLQTTDVAVDKTNFEYYIERISKEIVDTTRKHLSLAFYLSLDRAMMIAENEANTFFNFVDQEVAISQGYTMKRWVSERDNLVRPTHNEADSQTVPIRDYFFVGKAMMRYPKDIGGINVTADEIVNCRCTVEYF